MNNIVEYFFLSVSFFYDVSSAKKNTREKWEKTVEFSIQFYLIIWRHSDVKVELKYIILHRIFRWSQVERQSSQKAVTLPFFRENFAPLLMTRVNHWVFEEVEWLTWFLLFLRIEKLSDGLFRNNSFEVVFRI